MNLLEEAPLGDKEGKIKNLLEKKSDFKKPQKPKIQKKTPRGLISEKWGEGKTPKKKGEKFRGVKNFKKGKKTLKKNP